MTGQMAGLSPDVAGSRFVFNEFNRFIKMDLAKAQGVPLGIYLLSRRNPNSRIGAGDQKTTSRPIKVKIGPIFQAASIGAAIFLTAGSATATSISFHSNTVGTQFASHTGGTVSGSGLILSDASGDAATLTYLANVGTTVTVPTNIDFGNFILACPFARLA